MTPTRARLLCGAALLAAFGPALGHPLQLSWDDARFIRDNPLVQQISLANLRAIFGGVHMEAYHPLHLLSYWLDVPWAGANGPVLHTVSLLLWIGAAQLLLSVFGALGLSVSGALVATLACTLHPIQVEAVSWASGRKDILAFGFVAASMLLHLRSERAWDGAAWGSRVAFVCAVLSKTSALPLPLWLLACDVLLRGHSARRAVVRQLPSLMLCGAVSCVVVLIWHDHAMLRESAPHAAWLRALNTVHHQLATALWPSATAPMYSTQALNAFQVTHLWLPTGLLTALGVALRRRAPRVALALLGFVLFLVPVMNVVPMYFPFQDRYLSLSLLPLALGVGALWDRVHANTLGVALVSVALVAFGARTLQYSSEWASEPRLWGHAASTQPNAFYAWIKLAEVRRDADDLPGAARAVKRGLEVEPARRLGHALHFEIVALHDEKWRALSPSRARSYARDYYNRLEDPEALRMLTRQLLGAGYLRALELPMERALDLQPVPDDALERAALTHLRTGRPTLALVFASRMQKPSVDPALVALRAQAARYRAKL